MQAILQNWAGERYFEASPLRFTQMTVGAYNEDGSVRMDRLTRTEPLRLTVLFDRATQEFYRIQDVSSVMIKNALLVTIGVPLHFLGTLVWNIVAIPLELIKGLFYRLNVEKVKQHCLNCIRAPYYALGCEMAALCVLLRKPRDLRTLHMATILFASIERKWNHDLTRQKDALRHPTGGEGEEKTFFMGYCFQPLGSLAPSTQFYAFP